MTSVYYIKPMETLIPRQNENVSLTISFRAPKHFFSIQCKKHQHCGSEQMHAHIEMKQKVTNHSSWVKGALIPTIDSSQSILFPYTGIATLLILKSINGS